MRCLNFISVLFFYCDSPYFLLFRQSCSWRLPGCLHSRSGILSSAIFWISSLEIEATFCYIWYPEPESILHAFLRRTAAGGVFVMKLETSVCIYSNDNRNDHSFLSCCLRIKLLCKLYDIYSMLSKCRTMGWQRVAFQLGSCNLIYPSTFLAISSFLRIIASIHEISMISNCPRPNMFDLDSHHHLVLP